MNKKLILVFVIIAILLAAGSFYLWQSSNTGSQSQDTSSAQEEAVRQAKEYKPDGFCTQVLVPAVHTATGARYTFSNGCLAPGWEAERRE